MRDIILQKKLRQALPLVKNNKDFERYRDLLFRISALIEDSGIDERVYLYLLEEGERAKGEELSGKEAGWLYEYVRRGIRCILGRQLTGDSLREFSCRLCESLLFQQFCFIENFGLVRGLSKSALHRLEGFIPEGLVRELNELLKKAVSGGDKLDVGLSFSEYYADVTCLESAIHIPVDWVLLRDAVRTLMKSVLIIRREGLRNRMACPKSFISLINKHCMGMSHLRRVKGGRRKRKAVFRLMKKLLKKVALHARRHRELLADHWKETNLKEGTVRNILGRIDNVLSKLPRAISQAHERLIGGRQVASRDKLLSLYENDIHVIVRGKAGKEVEFGNHLFIAEQENGFITDWRLYKGFLDSDGSALIESLERLKDKRISSVTADRAFFTSGVKKYLNKTEIKNHIAPRSPKELDEMLEDDMFIARHRRRSQTEGRIGILKNVFLELSVRKKGYESTNVSTAWTILAHNLWVIARLTAAKKHKFKNAA